MFIIACTWTSVQDNERRDEAVPNPHADPGLPPGETGSDHGRDDHPCIDIEAVCYPAVGVVSP